MGIDHHNLQKIVHILDAIHSLAFQQRSFTAGDDRAYRRGDVLVREE